MPSRIKPKLDIAALTRLLGPPANEIVIHGDDRDIDLFDRMDAAYRLEHERWAYEHQNLGDSGFRYILVRNTSPNNDIIDESYHEVITLTKREARTRDEAEAWCNTFAGRASIRKALEAALK